MLAGSKRADSSRMRVVDSVTSVSAPPMTPASATGPARSAITSISSESGRSSPSSVSSRSPLRAGRTSMRGAEPPALASSRSRSKAWSGWPSSIST